jgi:hypothetical protein
MAAITTAARRVAVVRVRAAKALATGMAMVTVALAAVPDLVGLAAADLAARVEAPVAQEKVTGTVALAAVPDLVGLAAADLAARVEAPVAQEKATGTDRRAATVAARVAHLAAAIAGLPAQPVQEAQAAPEKAAIPVRTVRQARVMAIPPVTAVRRAVPRQAATVRPAMVGIASKSVDTMPLRKLRGQIPALGVALPGSSERALITATSCRIFCGTLPNGINQEESRTRCDAYNRRPASN